MMRTGMFVDIQNVQVTFERANLEVRYDVLYNFANDLAKEQGGVLWKALGFIPFVPDDPKRERLINALSFMGYRVIAKPVKRLPDGSFKANMDMDMALETVVAMSFLDEIILVTGDSDFVPLIRMINSGGLRCTVVGTKKGSVGIELIRASDRYFNLDEIDGATKPFEGGERFATKEREEDLGLDAGAFHIPEEPGEEEQGD